MKEIFERRSVRAFLNQPIEPEKIELLLKAAMAAPSAGNLREWRLIAVTQRPLLEKLAKVSPYAGCAAKAPLAIVVLGDLSGVKHSEYWEQDLGACTQNLLLEAQHLGLGAVWLGVAPLAERMEAVTELFDLPKQVRPFAIVAVGYPAEVPAPRERWEPEKAFYNGYQTR